MGPTARAREPTAPRHCTSSDRISPVFRVASYFPCVVPLSPQSLPLPQGRGLLSGEGHSFTRRQPRSLEQPWSSQALSTKWGARTATPPTCRRRGPGPGHLLTLLRLGSRICAANTVPDGWAIDENVRRANVISRYNVTEKPTSASHWASAASLRPGDREATPSGKRSPWGRAETLFPTRRPSLPGPLRWTQKSKLAQSLRLRMTPAVPLSSHGSKSNRTTEMRTRENGARRESFGVLGGYSFTCSLVVWF